MAQHSTEATHLIVPDISPQQALAQARTAEATARRRWRRVDRAVESLQRLAPVACPDTSACATPLARPA